MGVLGEGGVGSWGVRTGRVDLAEIWHTAILRLARVIIGKGAAQTSWEGDDGQRLAGAIGARAAGNPKTEVAAVILK